MNDLTRHTKWIIFAAILWCIYALATLPETPGVRVEWEPGRPDALAATGGERYETQRPLWARTTATWYGPGLYGNRTACGQTYTTKIRGVAIGRDELGRYLARCGQRFTIRYRGRVERVKVIDRCPGCVGYGHLFDLSARTSMDLQGCRRYCRPFTKTVSYRKGW